MPTHREKRKRMSVTKISQTEHLLNSFLELRDFCYTKERISEKKIKLTGNHLVQVDTIMKQMLVDLNVPSRSTDKGLGDKPVMQRIQKNLQTFETEILGNESVVARTVNVQNLIVHVDRIKERMAYREGYCIIL